MTARTLTPKLLPAHPVHWASPAVLTILFLAAALRAGTLGWLKKSHGLRREGVF